MSIDLTTPGLLFPAISLLLLAYTNRFLTLATLIRSLHGRYQETSDAKVMGQLRNLRKRVVLIRNMQILGISSLFLCVFCMLLLFLGQVLLAQLIFAASLFLLMASLGLSIYEIQISVNALNIQLSDLSGSGVPGARCEGVKSEHESVR